MGLTTTPMIMGALTTILVAEVPPTLPPVDSLRPTLPTSEAFLGADSVCALVSDVVF